MRGQAGEFEAERGRGEGECTGGGAGVGGQECQWERTVESVGEHLKCCKTGIDLEKEERGNGLEMLADVKQSTE